MMMQRRLSVLLVLSCSLMLSACGFRLRDANVLGDSFKQLYVASATPHAPLQRALNDRLSRYSVTSLPQTQKDAPTVYLYDEKLDRSLLSLFSTGQVAEYELNYHVRYEVKLPNQDAQLFEFELSREYQDNPNAVLAKSRELNLILDELRVQAADRIIRQLSILSSANH